MTNQEFLVFAMNKVLEYTVSHFDQTFSYELTLDDVYVVWSCKTLQNSKALLSTTVNDGMYYEVTYNGAKREVYFDAYKKQENLCFNV